MLYGDEWHAGNLSYHLNHRPSLGRIDVQREKLEFIDQNLYVY